MASGLRRMRALLPLAAIAAAMAFAVSVWGFGAMLGGYSQALHPVSLLGATGVPRGTAFNLIAFVLPGVVGALVAIDLRTRLGKGAGWGSRIGAQMLLLSAMGLLAMGLLPLDPQDIESEAGRLHGTAWMAWTVGFVAGAAALAFGLRREKFAASLALSTGLAAAAMALTAFVLTDGVGAGVAQRLAFLVCFAWLIHAARRAPLAA